MPGAIAEVCFPKGIVVNPNHALGDQALLRAGAGTYKVLTPDVYDVTPRVQVSPIVEHTLEVFKNGEGIIISKFPLSALEAADLGFFSNYDASEEKPVRRIDEEITEQFITGFRNQLLHLFSYLFFVSGTDDSRLRALEFIRETKHSK